MMVTVIADLVTFGVRPFQNLFATCDRLADHEERRSHSNVSQDIENRWRPFTWAIIESQGHRRPISWN
jgi:hypothetical protein